MEMITTVYDMKLELLRRMVDYAEHGDVHVHGDVAYEIMGTPHQIVDNTLKVFIRCDKNPRGAGYLHQIIRHACGEPNASLGYMREMPSGRIQVGVATVVGEILIEITHGTVDRQCVRKTVSSKAGKFDVFVARPEKRLGESLAELMDVYGDHGGRYSPDRCFRMACEANHVASMMRYGSETVDMKVAKANLSDEIIWQTAGGILTAQMPGVIEERARTLYQDPFWATAYDSLNLVRGHLPKAQAIETVSLVLHHMALSIAGESNIQVWNPKNVRINLETGKLWYSK